MSRAKKAPPAPLHPPRGASEAEIEAFYAAQWEAGRPERMAKREAEDLAHPCGYKGPLRKHNGERGNNQWGGHFPFGQQDEHHPPPRRRWNDGIDYRFSIGCMMLNNGMWFAEDAARVYRPGQRRDYDMGQSGGMFTHSRQFPSRDAAIRANAAWVLRLARIRFRASPGKYGVMSDWVIDEERYRQIVDHVYAVLAKPAPVVFVAPPPPPPPPPDPTDLLMWIDQGRQA